MPTALELVYVQFFSLMAFAGVFAWALMASPMRIAPKASKLFSITNLCMLLGMVFYYLRSDTINYLYWYGADFIFLVGFCCLRWGQQSLFKLPLTVSFDLTVLSVTTLCMFLFPPKQAFASYLMVIACLGAFTIFSFIVADNYRAVRKTISVYYATLITLPYAIVSLFFLVRGLLIIIYHDNQQLIVELTSLNSQLISWLYLSFILIINCMLFANALTRLVYKIRKLANKDQLTGLWNRHALSARLKVVDDLWQRNQQCYSLLILDLDHFKKINDTFGHLAGDAAIRHVADLLKNTLRKVDFICRYGGEEFLIVLPATNADQAYLVSEKIQASLNKNHLKWQQQHIGVKASIGFATIRDNQSVEQLLQITDDAMYQAKQQGRNTICTLTLADNNR